jgi:hypothetical protein
MLGVAHAQPAGAFQGGPEATAGVPDRQRGLVDDQGARLQSAPDRCAGSIEMAVVRLLLVGEHQRHDHHHHVRFPGRIGVGDRGADPPGRSGSRQALGKVRLTLIRDLPGVDHLDDSGEDIDADHPPAGLRVLRSERQPDLAQADHGHGAGGALLASPARRDLQHQLPSLISAQWTSDPLSSMG